MWPGTSTRSWARRCPRKCWSGTAGSSASEARAKAAVRGCVDWETLMEEAAASPIGSRGVMFLPHMGGAGCPVVDSRSRGGFAGLGTTATRGDMLRAVIEGLDYQLLDIVHELKKNVGFDMRTAGGCRRRGAKRFLAAEQGGRDRPAHRGARYRGRQPAGRRDARRASGSGSTATKPTHSSRCENPPAPSSRTLPQRPPMPVASRCTSRCTRP